MPADTESDEELMLRYARGDLAAFETLYGRHRGPLYRFVLRQVRDRAAADEVFQDTWLNLVRSRARYEARAKFTTLLYRMARNRVIDHHRSRSRASFEPFDEDSVAPAAGAGPAGAADPQRAADDEREVRRLRHLVAALPGEQREAFLLHLESGLGLEEIAAITGVGRETVKSRLRYAFAKLRAGMGAG